MADEPASSDDRDIWKAIREGKLIVRNGDGHIYYGEKASKEAEDSSKPIPGLVVIVLEDFQWEAFAERYRLEPTKE